MKLLALLTTISVALLIMGIIDAWRFTRSTHDRIVALKATLLGVLIIVGVFTVWVAIL